MSITVALYRGRQSERICSRLLAWWQRCDYSHCAIVREWSAEGLLLTDATLRHGVSTRWVPMQPWLWELWVLDGDEAAALARADVHVGEVYDWLGLLGFIWRRIKGMTAAQWCSELVMGAAVQMPDPWRWDVAHVACYLRRHATLIDSEAKS